jgi:hypothetical protein
MKLALVGSVISVTFVLFRFMKVDRLRSVFSVDYYIAEGHG